ncbi:MAG: hydantoinase/oxoprolinase family protein [Reyranella sp.]|uniref:hydantoinase/oxoprolinase family protein n=1 Tax=Reyranella sp. TaxID=1929291 RepID=UPI003D0BE034
MIHLAFDIGGTFTDFVLHDEATGRAWFLKVPSTPRSPEEAVLSGTDAILRQAGLALADVETVLHATTVATNAIIERKGAHVGLVTTEGFRDVVIIGRQKRYETYDLYIDKPAPLLRRRHVYEVRERISHTGEVLTPIDTASVDAAIDALCAAKHDAVAVSLLHSYANPRHERAIRDRILGRAPHVSVSLSSDVSPKFREYERTNTTVANAYIKPLVGRYVERLQGALAERGYRRDLLIMQSSGGLMTPELVRNHPIRIVESGPAAGVLMCAGVGRQEGFDQVVTFDMGGTTAKLGAVDDGQPAIAPSFEVDPVRYKKGSGLPISAPALELIEIGAGGGSIVRAEAGMITVGPQSAGSEPGPACYGRGGSEATVTDANVVLGYLDPGYFNGGAMPLDGAAAKRAVSQALAEPLGIGVGEAAWGAHLIATKNMEHAMRLVSVEQGRDPRKCVLVAFGGAGPLHAARLARQIGIPTVIVPLGAGVGSAVGLLQAERRFDVSVTRILRLDEASDATIAAIYAGLQDQAERELGHLGGGGIRWSRYAYMRYAGQGFEIQVDLPEGDIGPCYARRAAAAFHAAYARKHRWSETTAAVEAVDWTLVATVPTARRGTIRLAGAVAGGGAGRQSVRQAWFPEAGGYVATQVVDRQALTERGGIVGPAIVEDPDCTAIVLPGQTARISPAGNLRIEIASAGGCA